MRPIDHYGLKNASLGFKAFATFLLAASIALLGWNWFISLTVVEWNRADLPRMSALGADLLTLAWKQTGLFLTLLVIQAFAYGGLWVVIRMLYRRMALRRRIKGLLLTSSTGLVLLNFLVWLTLPFFNVSQRAAGPVGWASAGFLVALTLLPLARMWLHKRWKNPKPTRVVIVGGGFAGLYAALGLDKAMGHHAALEIVLIDRKNFFLFPPLLPSAAVGTIETRQVTQSYRRIFETTNIQYKKAIVTSVDPEAKIMRTDQGELTYDYLVLAPGATNQTFNTPGAYEYAFFVKELGDAIKIRDRIIDCFERAAVVEDGATQRGLLRFAVVGGGPTGIEIATEIRDLIHEVLLKRYPEIDPSWPEVAIIQSGPQVLPGWPDAVVRTTSAQLERLGIKLVLNNRVTEVQENAVILKEGAPVSARTIVWCAGVQPSPLLKTCGLTLDKTGRVPINEFLQAVDHPNVFVLGDAAACLDSKTNKFLPPLGQVAFQQGDHMAENLVRLLRSEPLLPFRYFNFGALVSVGEHYAAVDLLGVKLTGFIGWMVWRSLYLAKMIGTSTKLRILVDWTLDLLIERSIAQLQELPRQEAPPAPTPAEPGVPVATTR